MLIFNIFDATLRIENELRRFCNLFYYYNELVQGWFYDLFLMGFQGNLSAFVRYRYGFTSLRSWLGNSDYNLFEDKLKLFVKFLTSNKIRFWPNNVLSKLGSLRWMTFGAIVI